MLNSSVAIKNTRLVYRYLKLKFTMILALNIHISVENIESYLIKVE